VPAKQPSSRRQRPPVNAPAGPAAEIAAAARGAGLPLTQQQQTALLVYVETLLLWRSRISLTSARTAIEVIRRHVADSLRLARFIPAGSRVADIGSGAGFPGIPLAIACPTLHVTLIEARRKRSNFLREAIRRTNVSNVSVIEGRAEALLHSHAGRFDVALSRALGPLADFLRFAEHMLDTRGLAIAMKGPKGTLEARVVRSTAFEPPDLQQYSLLDGVPRTLLLYRRK
jgi:16S rRNA (guanine527-N7)-methyltransferase